MAVPMRPSQLISIPQGDELNPGAGTGGVVPFPQAWSHVRECWICHCSHLLCVIRQATGILRASETQGGGSWWELNEPSYTGGQHELVASRHSVCFPYYRYSFLLADTWNPPRRSSMAA